MTTKSYHLAWHRRHIPECDRFLVYLLVPSWLGIFSGSVELEAINSCGRHLKQEHAVMKDLASPRRPDDTEGIGHPLEVQLIRQLQIRATQAAHILPQVVPTIGTRGWARLQLSERDRSRLLRAGGVAL